MKNQAFTLIELLIVILIIGILVAIALPQYQVAVAKSKYNALKTHVNTLLSAVKLYHLTHGQWPTDVRDLDISLPGQVYWKTYIFLPDGEQCYIWYDANGNNGAVGCNVAGITYYVNFQNSTQRICRLSSGSTFKINKKVCFEDTGDTAPKNSGYDYYYKD